MKLKFLSIFLFALFATSFVFAQNNDSVNMQISDSGISVTSEDGSFMIHNDGASLNSNRFKDGDCFVNDKRVPCEDLGKGMFGLLVILPFLFLIIGLVLFVFWLMALIHALTKPIENKIVWVIVIVFVPFGFILYYFIEMRPFNKKMIAAYNAQVKSGQVENK